MNGFVLTLASRFRGTILDRIEGAAHGSRRPEPSRRSTRSRRLRLETLEDRMVLSSGLDPMGQFVVAYTAPLAAAPAAVAPVAASQPGVAAGKAALAAAAALPDLIPYRPDQSSYQWDNVIPVGIQQKAYNDTHSYTGPYYNNQKLYCNFAIITRGAAVDGFRVRLTLSNGTQSAYKEGNLGALDVDHFVMLTTDISFGPMAAGNYTLTLSVDTTNHVAESNESNNTYTRAFTITQQGGNKVRVVPRYLDSAYEGFNDYTLGTKRKAALEYAFGQWSTLLPASYAGETITVDVTMDPMGGSATSAVLGSTGVGVVYANFGGGQANTYYAPALANHLKGSDLNTGRSEVVMQMNSDVDNAIVLGSENWYYGTDGRTGNNIDFISVVMHELGHGLNILDLVNQNGTLMTYPGIYDRFLERGNGTDLTAMTDAGRASAIISGDLYWNGSRGAAGNSGSRPKMFAPNPYQGGSSVSHTDENTYPNDLMSPYYSGVQHTVSAMDLGILADMGWTNAGASLIAGAPAAAGSVARAMSVAPGRSVRSEYAMPLGALAAAMAPVESDMTSRNAWARASAIDRLMSTLDNDNTHKRTAALLAPSQWPVT